MESERAAVEQDDDAPVILVVEDEVLVRYAIADYLRDCGFHVVEAANAAEAIEVMASDLRVDILFTDVEMPGDMNGFELARWVRANRPELKVILSSGRRAKVQEARDLCLGEAFYEKPIVFEDLGDRIAQLLGWRKRP